MAEILIGAWVFVFGLVVGSFLNVCIYRLGRDLSVLRPLRSFCPACNQTIAWYDNIPVLSFFLLRGKCRACRKPISPRYVLVELLTALLFVLVYGIFLDQPGWILIGWFLAGALIVSTFIDFDYLIIPDGITLPGIALGLLMHFAFPALGRYAGHVQALGWSLLGAAVGGGSLWLIAVIGHKLYKKEVMGMGDVKLMAMVGAFVGWGKCLLAIFLGSFAGSLVGLLLIAAKKAKLQSHIPFGPYLSLGSLAAFLIGEKLISWYFGFFAGLRL